MTGIRADWFTDPRTVRFTVVCVFALVLMVRVFAGFVVRRWTQNNGRKRNLRYRIPLTLVHPRRPRAGGTASAVPIQGTRGREPAAAVKRSQP